MTDIAALRAQIDAEKNPARKAALAEQLAQITEKALAVTERRAAIHKGQRATLRDDTPLASPSALMKALAVDSLEGVADHLFAKVGGHGGVVRADQRGLTLKVGKTERTLIWPFTALEAEQQASALVKSMRKAGLQFEWNGNKAKIRSNGSLRGRVEVFYRKPTRVNLGGWIAHLYNANDDLFVQSSKGMPQDADADMPSVKAAAEKIAQREANYLGDARFVSGRPDSSDVFIGGGDDWQPTGRTSPNEIKPGMRLEVVIGSGLDSGKIGVVTGRNRERSDIELWNLRTDAGETIVIPGSRLLNPKASKSARATMRKASLLEEGGPNLDAMFTGEIEEFIRQAGQDRKAAARKMFPDRPLAIATDQVRFLLTYAKTKLAAMKAREDGDIPEAMELERKLDRIYESMPFKDW